MVLLPALVSIASCSSGNSASNSQSAGSASNSQGGGAGSTAGSSPNDDSSSSSVVAGARRVLQMLQSGWIYSKVPAPTEASQIEPYTSWLGPTQAPKPASKARVEVIVDTFQSVAAKASADGAVAAGRKLGWTVDEIDGQGSVQGFDQAFATAFSRNPQAIITIALSTQQIQDQLAIARSRGIITVAAVDVPPATGVKADAYVSFPQALMEVALAFEEIARTNGHARSIVLTDPGYVVTSGAMDAYANVMATCGGCKVYRANFLVSDTSDPAKVAADIAGELNSHPDATTLDLPFSLGLPAVIQAVKASGRNITILCKDGDSVGLEAVANGSIYADAGASVTWLGWATIDQVIRGLAKQPYLPGDLAGLGVAVATKANVPANGYIDGIAGIPNYVAEYEKTWGVG
jgi:ribose transport system substrate-binding protein